MGTVSYDNRLFQLEVVHLKGYVEYVRLTYGNSLGEEAEAGYLQNRT